MNTRETVIAAERIGISGRFHGAGSLVGWRKWGWAAGLVSVLVCLVTTLWYINALREGTPVAWGKILVKVGFEWYPWAIFAPLISSLVRRFPFDRARIIQSSLIHLGVAIGMAVLQNGSAILGLVVRGSIPASADRYWQEFVSYFLWMAPWSVVIYFGIAAIVSAVDFRSRWLQREWLSSKLESELTRAQLTTLYAQLQPHFLFNTLNSISVLVDSGRGPEAQTMLRHLSELLRYVLARGNTQEVTVTEELDFVRKYLDIEQVRYGDRLKYNMAVAAEAKTAKVPTFLIQTLVENAVRHGLAPVEKGGVVTISVSTGSGRLRLSVEDNGRGAGSPPGNESSPGVGLANAHSRLHHLYSGDYKLELVPGQSGGTVSRVEIPLTYF